MILIRIVDILFQVYFLLIVARIIGSWFPEFQRHRFFQFISFYTDPYLNLFRRFIPPIGVLDISPIIAIISLSLIEALVKTVLLLIISK